MTQLKIQNLEDSLSEVFSSKIKLNLDSDLRNYIKDSIDLGEVLAVMNLDIDLSTFKDVITVEEFLNKLNSRQDG